ncbi:SPFH domain-containing protein [Sciscionella sediminilitoris]|uniref:SPFH domain-containing protein n=1 Tax=Sciscionella sediminilitoris TaxID=1445613 RepID=UPI0004DEEDA6|nr:SPFH domain-containing protein [Sciscionella sp. SE31]
MTTTEPSNVRQRTPAIRERPIDAASGWTAIAVSVLLILVGAAGIAFAAVLGAALGIVLLVLGILFALLGLLGFAGLTPVIPGEARVLQLFGRYLGTIRSPGLKWVNPFTIRRPVSTRIRNHETSTLKVNDADGNPIEIAAVVVWHVHDTAQAVYEVDNFVQFVAIQTETAVRHIANSYPYGARDSERLSLLDNTEEITQQLSEEITARIKAAGVTIVESRITALAYAPEIAQVMLRRQQASAVVAARQQIVDGAVGMVREALSRLDEENVVELDEERRAAMVSNLLVVLCSEQSTQPVINSGSLYQ